MNEFDKFEPWRDCGEVTDFNLNGNYVLPPGISNWAGCYRLVLKDGYEYFGEAFNLHRRINEYCETASSESDRVMRDRIKKVGGMRVFISIQINAKASISKFKDHKTKFPGALEARRRFEQTSKEDAEARGVRTLNKR